MKKQLKEWTLPTLAVLCIFIAILDFAGLLDRYDWINSRIPTYTLLIIGCFILYFISSLSDFSFLKKDTKTILEKLENNQSEDNFLEKINFIWKKQESYIKDIFDYIRDEEKPDFPVLLDGLYREIAKGDFLGFKLKRPWDFTLTAINSKGVFIYHPNKEVIRSKAIVDEPYDEIFKHRNGEYVWINDREMSEQMLAITPELLFYRYSRFTKIYFQEFLEQNIIVSFESHINLLHEILPYES